MIYDQDKKTRVYQFQVGYMTHPMLEKHGTHIEQVVKMFLSKFQIKEVKAINELLTKNIYPFSRRCCFIITGI